MSSVGFVSKQQELDKLREAYDGLKDVLRGIESAKDCIDALNFGMAKDHLNAAAWHVAQVKKAIALVGQSSNEKASRC